MRSVAVSEGNHSSAEPAVIAAAVLRPRLFSGHARLIPLVVAITLFAGCSAYRPYIPESEGHILKPKPEAKADRAIPPPARVSTFVPPPKPKVKPQTYTVVVNEVPVKDLLLALARDTKQNIDIHPGITGLVSLNAVNETLPAILERVSKQVNMRYRVEGNTIIVSPDMAYVKTYRVGYVNMIRDTTSSIGVTGEIAAAGGTGAVAGASASGGSGGSSTTVRTTSRNDFWEQLRDNIRSILNSTRMQSLDAQGRAERLALVKQEQELRAKQMEAASRAGQGAPTLASSVIAATGGSQRTSLLPDDVVVNPISGTLTVNATEKQHQLVQQHIDSIVTSMNRQVLIEASIVEVRLSNDFQAGIDWQRLSQSGGFAFTQSLLGSALSTAPFFSATYGIDENGRRSGSITGTIKLLEQFGNTRVLSSPKLMALNNQTALLKVVDNVVYFEIKSDTTQAQTTSVSTVSTTARTVAVGVVMGVTPQVGDDDRVSLTVRPTITRLNPVQPFVNDPNPTLCDENRTNCLQNPVPQVQTREMESVLQINNGQIVVLGGLMQDESRRNRDQIPGLGNVPDVGDLFAFRDEQVSKSELVIFLRTTIVKNPTLDSDELKFFQRFLPQPEAKPDLSKVPKDLRPPNQREQTPTSPAGATQ
ncbi:MAG: pilus (MSHA type) biogenesis protein MshL [Betaproteobacteria bacterium]|nr:MAG: pilus (MSHA type) biogenesis protein MshL [Betaproteobacteria bacterium]